MSLHLLDPIPSTFGVRIIVFPPGPPHLMCVRAVERGTFMADMERLLIKSQYAGTYQIEYGS